jgi:PAS domain S-box-containing protein
MNHGDDHHSTAEALRRCTSELERTMEQLERESEANRLAREQFRDMYREMTAIMETSLAGIVMTHQLEITRINKTAAAMLGFGVEELVGRDLAAFLPLEGGEASPRCFERILAGECVEGRECVCEHGGEPRSLRVSARPIEPGAPERGVVWVFTDITREVEARQLREDVDRITRHDLKGPLQAILGAPELLAMEGNLSDSQLKLVQMVESSAADMLEMINLSLDLYKMETGRYELSPEVVDLGPVIRKVVEELGPLRRARNAAVQTRVDGEDLEERPVLVLGEELLLRSMLANVLQNALEAAPEGSVVEVDAVSGDGTRRVSIRNHGAVPEEVRDRFFEKYSTAGKRRGTGLGTYSARLIAETLGGSIALDSRPEDTEVRVILPAPRG